MLDFSRFDSLMSLIEFFSSNEACKSFLAESRWSDGDVICPYCGKHHCFIRKDGRYRCTKCKRNFSVTVGTIFHSTNLSLKKWFIGIYLFSSHKKGISSHQLARDLKVTQKTAWFMLSKIRTLTVQKEVRLSGTVELDEAYIGGEERWKHADKHVEGTQGRSTKTKTPIFGLAERGGDIVVKQVENTKGKTLSPIIQHFIEKGSKVFTDEYQAYWNLADLEYLHGVVFHKSKKYVDGDVSTNCVEGFWSHFKRMIKGIYHYISVERMQMYIDEQVLRWNTRKESEGVRFEIILGRINGVVTRKDVVAMSSRFDDTDPTNVMAA